MARDPRPLEVLLGSSAPCLSLLIGYFEVRHACAGAAREHGMPTLQCTCCGATHDTAATGPHLALTPLMFGCQACGCREPLRIGVISDSSDRDKLARVARDEAKSTRMRTDA
jgi:hypothetical protein